MAQTGEKGKAPANKPEETSEKRRFIGFSERRRMIREERANKLKQQPWIVQKLVVGIVVAIAAYGWYVYIGRFCVPMIRKKPNALGSRGMGIAFVAVFSALGLMFWWTYIKLILTPPGFARDYVERGFPTPPEPPRRTNRYQPPPPSAPYQRDIGSEEDNIGGPPYDEIPQRQRTRQASQSSQTPSKRDPEKNDLPASPTSSRTRRPSTTSPTPKRSHSVRSERTMQEPQAGVTDAIPAVAQVRTRAFSDPKLSPLPPKDVPHTRPKRRESERSRQSQGSERQRQRPGNANAQPDDDLPPPELSRRPPLHPTLLPEYRFCRREEIVKPMRAHHCSTCSTCVLMYDHHCPWIGQCVGAGNHKFFVNFIQWSTPWTLWIFTTLVGLIAKKSNDPSFNVDGQQIAIIALSGLFSFLTGSLLGAHIRLIWYNLTSVESLWIHGMKSREREILGTLAPLWDWRKMNVHRKRSRIRKEWDREWGELYTEGNIWWLGSPRANWEYRMGRNPWGWFLPIGRSEGDGLTFPVNPRFDADGRWRRRKNWPSELR